MTRLYLKVVPAKVRKDGTHNVRVALSHNGDTRYIPTGVTVDSPSEFAEGKVIGRPDRVIKNMKLAQLLSTYQDRLNDIEYLDVLDCNQAIELIKTDTTLGRNRQSLYEISEEYISQLEDIEGKSTKLYRLAISRYLEYTSKDTRIESLSPLRVNQYIMYLKGAGLSDTTVNIYITLLKVIVHYAEKMGYVKFKVSPFVTARIPRINKRHTAITVEELRKVRDMEIRDYSLRVVRDIFMLTYYLAGINFVDLIAYNFKGTEIVSYIRKKTRNTKEGENKITYTIPEEAKPIIAQYMNKRTGKLEFGKFKNYTSCYNALTRHLPELATRAGIQHRFTLYSARKSFTQHGYDLGVPLSTLEYCIGHSMKEDRPIFNYVTIMQQHADQAIRTILDHLRGDDQQPESIPCNG